MTKSEIVAELAAFGVEASTSATKAELEELLAETHAAAATIRTKGI